MNAASNLFPTLPARSALSSAEAEGTSALANPYSTATDGRISKILSQHHCHPRRLEGNGVSPQLGDERSVRSYVHEISDHYG